MISVQVVRLLAFVGNTIVGFSQKKTGDTNRSQYLHATAVTDLQAARNRQSPPGQVGRYCA